MPATAPRDRSAARPTAGRAFARVLFALVLGAAVLLPAALPASPAAAGTSCDGVTVRVERPGSTVERCAKGPLDDGLHALQKAGFSSTFVDGQPGFVCTIDRYPDPCNGAPADAYWSYWHADAGATSWTYASRGGGNRTPPPGTHDAWVFGSGTPPSSPPPAPSPSPTTSPSPSPSTSPSPSPSPSPSGPSPTTSSDGSDSSGRGGGSSDGSEDATTDGPSAPRSTDDTGDSDGGAAPRGPVDGGDEAPPDGASRQDDAEDGDEERDADDADRADGRPGDDDASDEHAADEDAPVRPEALDDTVTVEAPGGGRSGAAAIAGALLVVGLGAAGLLRARGRRGEPDGEA